MEKPMSARHFLSVLVLLTLLAATPTSVGADVVFVDSGSACDATDCSRCGSSWAAAFPDIQKAIDCTTGETEIRVAAGTYGPIELRDGAKILGGYAVGDTERQDSMPRDRDTVIDGEGLRRGIVGIGCGEGTVVYGVTIRGGADLDTRQGGGGAYLESCDAQFVWVSFIRNHSDFAGGAVSVRGSDATFSNCRFIENGHEYDPSGRRIGRTLGAGAVFVHSGAPSFTNCLFAGNAAHEAGAIANIYGRPRFEHCTIVRNRSTLRHGGAVSDYAGVEIRSSIVWGNESAEGRHVIANGVAGLTSVRYSDIQGGWTGDGNIESDPRFVAPVNGDFRLAAESPCIDAADDGSIASDRGDTDLDGDVDETGPDLLGMNRLHGVRADIGAYEAQ